MPKRVPNASVIVIRDKKRIEPPLGRSFDFTAAEIETITRLQPGALRKPVNESAEDEGHTSDDSQAGKEATSASAPQGSKKAKSTKGPKAEAKAASQEREETGQRGNESSENDSDADEDENDSDNGGDADEDEDI